MKNNKETSEIKLLTYKKNIQTPKDIQEIFEIQDFYKIFNDKFPNIHPKKIELNWNNLEENLKKYDLKLKWIVYKYKFLYQFSNKHKHLLYSKKTTLDTKWLKKMFDIVKDIEDLPEDILDLLLILKEDPKQKTDLSTIYNLIIDIIPKDILNKDFLKSFTLNNEKNIATTTDDKLFNSNLNTISIIKVCLKTNSTIIWENNINKIIFNKSDIKDVINNIFLKNKNRLPEDIIFDEIFWLLKINNIVYELSNWLNYKLNKNENPFIKTINFLTKIIELQNTIKQNNDNIQKKILLLSYDNKLYKIWNLIKNISDIYEIIEIWFLEYIRNLDIKLQKDLIKFYYKNQNFVKSNINILINLNPENLLKLDIIINNNLSKKDIILIIENNLLDIKELFENPKIITYINTFIKKYWNYNIEQIVKLDTEIIIFLIENNFSKTDINDIIKNKLTLLKVKSFYKINNYKQTIKSEISYIPNIYKEKDEIINFSNSINPENFEIIEWKINKILNNIKNIINKSKLWINKWIDINYTIESFINKKTKGNKLKISIVLNIIDYMYNNFSSTEIMNFSKLLSKSNIILWNNFIIKYETILTTIFNNYILFENFTNNTTSNIKLEEIEQYIKSNEFENMKNDLINLYFWDNIKDFIFEIKDTDKFENIIHIAKLLWWFKEISEDTLLNLITLDRIKLFKIDLFLEIIKDNILNNINKHSEEIINICIQILDNWELENIKKIIIENNFWNEFDDSFKYAWFNEFIYNKENWIEIFKDLIDLEKNIEKPKEKINISIKWLWWFSWKEIIGKLKRNWFYFKKVNWKIQWKWDHVLLTDWERTVLIPIHKQVKAWNLLDRLKSLWISTNDFLSM